MKFFINWGRIKLLLLLGCFSILKLENVVLSKLENFKQICWLFICLLNVFEEDINLKDESELKRFVFQLFKIVDYFLLRWLNYPAMILQFLDIYSLLVFINKNSVKKVDNALRESLRNMHLRRHFVCHYSHQIKFLIFGVLCYFCSSKVSTSFEGYFPKENLV